MSNTDYSSLPTQKRRTVVENIVDGDFDKTHKDLLFNRTEQEVKKGTFYPLGEPVSSVRCDGCCDSINLNDRCAALKRFTVEETTANPVVEHTPELLCMECATLPAQFANEDEVGVLIAGVLSRRRTRPGDNSEAPYLLHMEEIDHSTRELVRPQQSDRRPEWSSFK